MTNNSIITMSTRKVKDAKDLESNELIYFKGHAKETYLSDGRNVEDAINDNQVDLTDYATKNDVSTAIAQAITTTLNTKV